MSSEAEEVEDYMSDKFVNKDDIRPSLLFSHSLRVKHESIKKKEESDPKPKGFYRELEKDLREEALNTPLDETNKGFQMLAKMGFTGYQKTYSSSTDGQTSGVDGQTTVGTSTFGSEPIKIEVKSDRKGLGTEPKSKSVRKADQMDDKLTEEQYRTHKRSKKLLGLTEKDLRTAQKVCRNLDTDSGLDEKQFLKQTALPKWFWPHIHEQTTDDIEGEEQEEEEDIEECFESRLMTINGYLRDKYFYCIWCGIRFNDRKDLSDNCLGETRDDHQ